MVARAAVHGRQGAPPHLATMRDVNGVHLHVVEAGPPDGPLVILLHGFPDFWWGWRRQIEPLAAQGFHVVVPDQRGYNQSDKPRGLAAYQIDTLAADVIRLAASYNCSRFHLVGHDWGGLVAWWTAMRYPTQVDHLAIVNAPHPEVWRYMKHHRFRQAMRSAYVAFFQLPWLPELVLKAGNFMLLRRALMHSSRPFAFTAEDMAWYVEAWARPGALTAMLNYYRALRYKPSGAPVRIQPPTLLIWGQQDRFLDPAVAQASLALCDHGQALFLDTATHWVQLEEVEIVNNALNHFLKDW